MGGVSFRRAGSLASLPGVCLRGAPPRSTRPTPWPLRRARVGLLAFMCVAANTYVLTTAGEFLIHLGDEQHNHLYLRIFTILQPASILGMPFMNWMLNRRGYRASLQFIKLLGLAHGIIQVSSTNLNVQVFGFLVFPFYWFFLFSMCFSFLPTYMEPTAMGRGAGLVSSSQGIECLVNIPLAAVPINGLDGDFFWSDLAYTLAFIPCIAMAWVIWKDVEADKGKKKYC